jgi:O-antigen ligase
MQPFRRPRLGLPILVQAALVTLVLMPTLWLSGQAPAARSIALPAVGILALALFAANEAPPRPWSASREGSSAFCCRLWSVACSGCHKVPAGRLCSPSVPALLYLLWVAIGTVRVWGGASAGATDFARGEMLRLAGGVAVYLAISRSVSAWQKARQLVDALLGGAIAGIILALAIHHGEEPSLRGAFGNSQLFASFLLQLAPLSLALAVGAPNPRRRLVAQVATGLSLTALTLSQTRSAWLGGVVALVVLAALLTGFPHRRRRRRDPRPAIAAGLLALAGLGWLVCHANVAGPLLERAATLGRLSDDQGLHWRLRQWRVAESLWQERPLDGHGPGSFPLEAAPRLPQPIPLAVVLSTGPNLALNAHSLYLQILAENGMVGLLLYLWMVVAFLESGRRALSKVSAAATRSRRKPEPQGQEEQSLNLSHGSRQRSEARSRYLVLAGCMAAVAGGTVDALANPAYQFGDVTLFFWTVVGLGTAIARGVSRSQSQPARRSSVGPSVQPMARLSRYPSPQRLAAAVVGAGLFIVGSVAGSSLPTNTAEYVPFQSLRVTALTTPGYLTSTVLPGECVEMRAVGALERGGDQDVTGQCRFSRAGGTAPVDCLEQLPAPHANLFCLPVGAPAEDDGQTVQLQGTLDFNGQTLTSPGPMLVLSVPRACPGVQLQATPRVLPPTEEMEDVRVSYVSGTLRFQRLQRVECNEPLARDDVRTLSSTHLLLRATSTIPGRRIYTLYYRFLDRQNRFWMAPIQIYVR